MATILRTWSYQYPWLYNTVSRLAAIAVGGETRFHQLPLQDIPIDSNTKILDLCCGGGQATRFLVERSSDVTGLDASPNALKRAKERVPRGSYVEGLAEQLPFADEQFDVVHTSVALHEMEPAQLQQILKEVYRVLKPGGIFTLIDLHEPTNILFWPSLAIFIWLFETETAWSLLKTDLVADLKALGWRECHQRLYAGGSLQVIQGTK